MRRSPLAVFCRVRGRGLGHPLVASLVEDARFETTLWALREGGGLFRVRNGSVEEKRSVGLAPTAELRWLHSFTLDPELLAGGLGLRFIGGPMAARPKAILGFGLQAEGYLAAAVGRILGVPSAIAALDGDGEAAGVRVRKVLRWSPTVLAASDELADALARRGARPLTAPGATEDGRWTRLGRSWIEALSEAFDASAQGASVRISRS